MTIEQFEKAQEYLTLVSEDRVKRIVDIRPLLMRHTPRAVIWFLKNLYWEKEVQLRALIREDRTSSLINEVVAIMFRVRMALWIMEEEEREEVDAA
jgi:hypothetical protein